MMSSTSIAPPRGVVGSAPPPPAALKQSFVSFQHQPSEQPAQQHFPPMAAGLQSSSLPNSSFYGYDPHGVQPVQLSMHSFFEREAQTAREKTQLAMSRQLQPRLRTSGFAAAHPTLVPSASHEKISMDRKQYIVALNSTAASLPATHQKVAQEDLNAAPSSSFGTRPFATPAHSRFESGKPAADPTEMRRNIFAYKRL